MADNQEEHTTSYRTLEMKVTPNIHLMEYIDTPYDSSLLYLIDLSLSIFKKHIMARVPRNAAEVGVHYNVLADLPNFQIFTSTELHKKIYAEVLSDIFGIRIELERATLRDTS